MTEPERLERPARAEVFDIETMSVQEVVPGLSRTGFRSNDSLTTINWLERDYRSKGTHSHPFDQVSFVVAGTMRFFLGEETVDVAAPGAVYIPADLPHGGEPVGDERVLNIDVFAPVRGDYLKYCVNRDQFEQ